MIEAELLQLVEYGFAGPFMLENVDVPEEMQASIGRYKAPGVINMVLSKVGLAQNLRLQQKHGHTAFRPLYELAADQQLLDDIEPVLGPNLLLWKARILVREPGSSGQNWHVAFNNKLVGGVHVSIAFSDMDADNGALQVIPGSHRYDVSLSQSQREGLCDLGDSGSLVVLADTMHPEAAPHRLVTMPLKAAQYFVMTGGLWHGVLPNRTDAPRVAALARYMRPDVQSRNWSHDDAVPRAIGKSSLPCILVRGEDTHRLNRLCQTPGPRSPKRLKAA